MPLTTLQKEVLVILAGNRSEESHFAGGVVLNVADHSARFSHDFDIFHELAEEVTRALRDVTRGDLLVDGRAVIDPVRAAAAGFRYRGVGGLPAG